MGICEGYFYHFSQKKKGCNLDCRPWVSGTISFLPRIVLEFYLFSVYFASKTLRLMDIRLYEVRNIPPVFSVFYKDLSVDELRVFAGIWSEIVWFLWRLIVPIIVTKNGCLVKGLFAIFLLQQQRINLWKGWNMSSVIKIIACRDSKLKPIENYHGLWSSVTPRPLRVNKFIPTDIIMLSSHISFSSYHSKRKLK